MWGLFLFSYGYEIPFSCTRFPDMVTKWRKRVHIQFGHNLPTLHAIIGLTEPHTPLYVADQVGSYWLCYRAHDTSQTRTGKTATCRFILCRGINSGTPCLWGCLLFKIFKRYSKPSVFNFYIIFSFTARQQGLPFSLTELYFNRCRMRNSSTTENPLVVQTNIDEYPQNPWHISDYTL